MGTWHPWTFGVPRVLAAIVLALLTDAQTANYSAPVSLDLEPFEDDDCLETAGADVLLTLMHDMGNLLEQAVYASDSEAAWSTFDNWAENNTFIMIKLAGSLLIKPYCEPMKIAWMALECILLIRSEGKEKALECVEALDEDILLQMTPRGSNYVTRFHLVLRSPWPALRMLDLLVRLYPETGTTRMGACRRYHNWQSEPDIFDWPWFKPTLLTMVDSVTMDPSVFDLRPSDGPLSRQYRSRWLRVYEEVPGMREAMSFSDDVFDKYREHHYKAGCHLGVIASYALQVLLVHLRDVEGRLQRYIASVAQLINIHAPFTHLVRSDWPVFRVLYIASHLQRSPPERAWREGLGEYRAEADAAKVLCSKVSGVVGSAMGATRIQRYIPMVFVTAAWGHLAKFTALVLERWDAIVGATAAGRNGEESRSYPVLIFLAMDITASKQCAKVSSVKVHCVEAPERFGVEAFVAKYLSLAAITRLGVTAVWLDVDVYILSDPTPYFKAALDAPVAAELIFARHLMTESVSPAVVVARGSVEATELLMKYANWLRENPFLLDHQGWDQFLDNRPGDFAGGFDYQGRNVTVKDDKGPPLSFLPTTGIALPGTRYKTLGSEFGSGDGWVGDADGRSMALFHFWGATQPQEELFQLLYPRELPGLPERALPTLRQYRRTPTSGPTLKAIMAGAAAGRGSRRVLHVVQVSYADGCCKKSLQHNRRQALAVGVDHALAYGRGDLDPSWVSQHGAILGQKRGGGWWLWKPHVILNTLRDPAVPWHRGVVVWVDAGNHLHSDPRPLLESALSNSDVAALRLKWCLEADWTSRLSLHRLNVSERYAVVDRPQLGAYLLMFRKTQVAISFVEEWLHFAQDPETLLGAEAYADFSAKQAGEETGADVKAVNTRETPSFQKHQADQSVFSVLFKERGFQAASLEEGHRVVKLARWRE